MWVLYLLYRPKFKQKFWRKPLIENESPTDTWCYSRRAVTPSLPFPIQGTHFLACDADVRGEIFLLLFFLENCYLKPQNDSRVLTYRQLSWGFPVECSWPHATIPILACIVSSLRELITPVPFLFLFSIVILSKWHHAYFNSERRDISWSRNRSKVELHKTAKPCSDNEGSQSNSLNE